MNKAPRIPFWGYTNKAVISRLRDFQIKKYPTFSCGMGF
jgi:hypothetical protein